MKEWQCPLRGNSFVVPFVNLVLFAYLVMDYNLAFAKVLFWIGAPISLALSFWKVRGRQEAGSSNLSPL